MANSIVTFLMFDGVAEAAMNFYVSLFPNSEIKQIDRFGPGEQGAAGSIKRGEVTLSGHSLIFFDSPVKHAFTFTPAISLFVDCESEAELDNAYAKLVEGGQALMPLANYGFSKKFGWVNDRYGVSWQVNLR